MGLSDTVQGAFVARPLATPSVRRECGWVLAPVQPSWPCAAQCRLSWQALRVSRTVPSAASASLFGCCGRVFGPFSSPKRGERTRGLAFSARGFFSFLLSEAIFLRSGEIRKHTLQRYRRNSKCLAQKYILRFVLKPCLVNFLIER